MYWQRARHPRAGIAIGAVILGAWAGAVGLAFAGDGSADADRAPAAPAVEALAPQR